MNILKRMYNTIMDKFYGKRLIKDTEVASELFDIVKGYFEKNDLYLPDICWGAKYNNSISFTIIIKDSRFSYNKVFLHINYNKYGPSLIHLYYDVRNCYLLCRDINGNLYIDYKGKGTKYANVVHVNRNMTYDFIQYIISKYEKYIDSDLQNRYRNGVKPYNKLVIR